MVKLAQALVHGPTLLMLDEPTNGLDPPARKRMLDLVRDIRERGETHLLVSSHLLRDVESVCDEVIILKQGRIAATCDLEAERRANKSFVEIELQSPEPKFAEALGRARVRTGGPGHDPAQTGDARRSFGAGPLHRRRSARSRHPPSRHQARFSLQDIFLRAMEVNHGRV